MTEVVLLKLSLRHNRYYIFLGVSEILHVYFDISQELIVLGEYRNDRDWNRSLNNVANVHDLNNVPLLSIFSSEKMFLKFLRSSSGRWLSIGMQYLLKYKYQQCGLNREHLSIQPYRV